MPVVINGTTGVSGVDGSASTPALQGSDTNTGVYFGADTVYLVEGGAEGLRLNSSGNTQLAGNLGLGGTTPSTSGTGITFPATVSDSSNANTLDDYEEGTFTPAFKGSTSDPTVSYNWRYGYYTKIGNQVTLWFGLNTSSYSGGSGNLYVSLPFVSANRADNRAPGSIRATMTFTGQLAPYNYENTAECYFGTFTSGSATAFLTVSAIGASNSVQIVLTYTV